MKMSKNNDKCQKMFILNIIERGEDRLKNDYHFNLIYALGKECRGL